MPGRTPFQPYDKSTFGNVRQGDYTKLEDDGSLTQYGDGENVLNETEVETLSLREQSSDPTDPAEGKAVAWMSDGTDTGDDGDILIKEQSGSVIEQVSLKWKNFVPSSLNKVVGGVASGTVSDVQVYADGNYYQIAETSGVPGFHATFTFSGVDRYCRFLTVRFVYTGVVGHYVNIGMMNYDTATQDYITSVIPKGTNYQQVTLYLPTENYVSSGGAAIVDFYHITSGTPGHLIQFDYIGLSHSLQGVF